MSNSDAVWANSSSSVRQLLLLDRGDLDGDVDGLVAELAADQRRLEGLLVAGRHALERLVEALEHGAAADLVAHAGGLSLLDRLAVLGRGQVDRDEVVVGGCPLDRGQRAEALAQRLELLVDLVVADLDRVDLGLETGVGRQRDLGLDVELGAEAQVGAVLDLVEVELGLAQRDDVVLLQGLEVQLRERLVDGLTDHVRRGRPGGR